jgi:methylglutaconyl-CoA hydratase
MSDIERELHKRICILTLNRPSKINALNSQLLSSLHSALEEAIEDPAVKVILLKANGKHFSAGADINWMQNMLGLSEEENIKDAMVLANVLHTLHFSPKPTVASVQGAAYGGGAGLVAACDFAIASTSAHFCFSEVKLGLIPAIISPYVIKAVGPKIAKWLFISAEKINAEQAKEYHLVQYCVEDSKLDLFSLEKALHLAQLPPEAVTDCKNLVNQVTGQAITEKLIQHTATLIAKKRVSIEGQAGMKAFIEKGSNNAKVQ